MKLSRNGGISTSVSDLQVSLGGVVVSRRGWYLGILAVKSDFGLRSGVDLGETSYLLRFCWASEILRRRARGCVGCCVVATAAVLFVYRCRSRS
ncbi:hypothetical protein Bca52824_065700 [Brassica carinata]|uniref:Uncharacterized protein n=1 Tax=Brassica carinata TaxID=52824 RepID=A0A8X7QIW0_BRACI|nr:hypothetical protein Bca52824_065700 [Brassica carinata]